MLEVMRSIRTGTERAAIRIAALVADRVCDASCASLQSFAGAARQRHVHRRFRQLLAEAALIEFGHQRPLQLVAFVEEGEPEGEADIVEDFGVLGPGDHRARATSRSRCRRS